MGTRTLSSVLASFVASAVVVLAAPAAQAIPAYPNSLVIDLKITWGQVPCSLCHLEGNIGHGSARTPFALNMRDRGLNIVDESTIDTALAKLTADKVDSDGDGLLDVDEIHNDTDPNSPVNDALGSRAEVAHGCNQNIPSGSHLAPKVEGGIAGLLTFVGLVLFARRRRR